MNSVLTPSSRSTRITQKASPSGPNLHCVFLTNGKFGDARLLKDPAGKNETAESDLLAIQLGRARREHRTVEQRSQRHVQLEIVERDVVDDARAQRLRGPPPLA